MLGKYCGIGLSSPLRAESLEGYLWLDQYLTFCYWK